MRTPRVLATTAAVALATAALTASTGGPAHADPPSSQYTLVLDDEFNGSAVDTNRWNYRTDVKALSAQRPGNVSQSGGVLNIALKQESYAGKNFTGGGVVSKQPFRYGYYETRAKINDGAGWHTSFWLKYGADPSTTFDPAQKTEIDGFEINSASPTSLQHSINKWSDATHYTQVTSGMYKIGLDLRQWHTYGIDWEETSVKWYVDGVLKYTASYLPRDWTHDYTNIWLTSIAYGTTPDTTKLPSAVQFDYARYYQRDYYLDNDGPAAYGYSETGTWQNSTETGWTYNSPTRVATCNSAGNTATWRPNLRATGTYQVYAWNIVRSNSDTNAQYAVVHNGTTTTTHINGQTGTSGWVSLGSYSFPAGTGGSVTLTSSGNGCARADAVKFVRQ